MIVIILISGCVQETTEEKTKTNDLTTTPTTSIKSTTPKPFKISLEGYWLGGSGIHGDKIVFHGENSNSDIFMYDTITGKTTQITFDNSNQLHPFIYGKKIIWQDERFSPSHYFLYDISTKEEKDLGVEISGYWRDFFDNILAEINYVKPSGETTLYVYNLETQQSKEIVLEERMYDPKYLQVYNDKIVWSARPKDNNPKDNEDIYLYDLSKESLIKITNDSSFSHTNPSIFENKIVWSDNRNGLNNYDIYMYDLSTGKETHVTTQQDTIEKMPFIFDDKVVYIKWKQGEREKGGYMDVYMYDLSKKTETRISTDTWDKDYPKIYENKIIWQGWSCDCSEADKIIYLYIF